MKRLEIAFRSGQIKLEGLLYLPGEDRSVTLPGAALCHPHPLYGGNMHNNVVKAVARALCESKQVVLTFNFRGVGLSEGTFDDGRGEQQDLEAALSTLAERPEVDHNSLAVVGYSFGGMIALDLAKKSDTIGRVAAVSPVINPGLLQGLDKPAFFICGSEDQVISVDLLSREIKEKVARGQLEIVKGADHFWIGHEAAIAARVAEFIT